MKDEDATKERRKEAERKGRSERGAGGGGSTLTTACIDITRPQSPCSMNQALVPTRYGFP